MVKGIFCIVRTETDSLPASSWEVRPRSARSRR